MTLSVTFKATSNDVQPTPVDIQSFDTKDKPSEDKEVLRDIIKQNDVFIDALKDKKGKIIQSSSCSQTILPAHQGLVSSIVKAYNMHHNLILRPDDIWQAILTQFSFYVNANAEDLRDCFVDFQGKKKLTIKTAGTLFSVDFGTFARRMVDEQICANLKDPTVTEWLLPSFTTTRLEDRVVASVTIMSTLQKYFEYHCMIMCGIPEVTLLGSVEDWRKLREKIDGLLKYDIEGKDAVMNEWHSMISKVLDQIVLSAEGKPDLSFWDTIVSHHGGGSGPSYLSGWVTVFGCFKVDGTWQGSKRGSKSWPFIETSDIPEGTVSVPVSIDDNGTPYKSQMVAGQIAYEIRGEKMDTIQPRSDWCIALVQK